MKIIVCGAGRIGKSMVSYLSYGNNDIIVIDKDQQKLDEISKEWDIMPILGNASHPEILEKAEAKDADLILALTNSDEVNMISCQVADCLFHVRQKIARIDSPDFLDPLWCELYNPQNINIDLLISPDYEIAEAIYGIIKIPGAFSVMPLADKKLYLLSVKCQENSPLLKTPIERIEMIAPDISLSPVSVVRNGRNFIPTPEFTLEIGDELYFLIGKEEIEDAMTALGFTRPSNEKILIFGGDRVAYYLAKKLEDDDNITSCKIIEDDKERAKYLAQNLEDASVIYGEMLSDVILEEAEVDSVDVTVSATLRDKDNLLASLIAKKNGAATTISLVNSKAYNTLVSNLSDSIIVDSSSVTVSAILKELRKANIKQAHSLGRGFGEVWELEVDEHSIIAEKKINDLDLPENSKICVIIRGETIIYPDIYEKILAGDKLVLYCSSKAIKKVEKIFA